MLAEVNMESAFRICYFFGATLADSASIFSIAVLSSALACCGVSLVDLVACARVGVGALPTGVGTGLGLAAVLVAGSSPELVACANNVFI